MRLVENSETGARAIQAYSTMTGRWNNLYTSKSFTIRRDMNVDREWKWWLELSKRTT